MSRIQDLQSLLQKQPKDSFLLYALALEHKKAGDAVAALEHLRQTLDADPHYCYAYFQQGEIHETLGQTDQAIAAYRAGIVAAEAAGDAHARSELAAALDILT